MMTAVIGVHQAGTRTELHLEVLTMPTFGRWSHCGKWSCFHTRCLQARERLRRCYVCNERIQSGARYIEERDSRGNLMMQAHETCLCGPR